MKSSYSKKENPVFCDSLRFPVLSEKTVRLQENGVYVFVVSSWAKKDLVRKAVESVFDVKVRKVSILNRKGKVKSFRGRSGVRSDVRRAHVSLDAGSRIDFSAGVA